MLEYVMVELDESSPTKITAAQRVKEALLAQGDTTSSVFSRSQSEVLVGVVESSDPIQEITNRLNDAALSCFVDETEDEATDEELETVITDLTTDE